MGMSTHQLLVYGNANTITWITILILKRTARTIPGRLALRKNQNAIGALMAAIWKLVVKVIKNPGILFLEKQINTILDEDREDYVAIRDDHLGAYLLNPL